MSTTNRTCPVCGAGQEMRRGATADCAACATPYAFAEHFASRESLEAWEAVIRQKIALRRQQRFQKIRETCSLVLGPEYLAFHDSERSRLFFFDQSGKPVVESNVRQYSVSNLHQVTLKNNGTVTAKGDTDVAQVKLTGVKAILAAPRCTYVVNSDGTVSAHGITPVRQEIAQWKNIRSVVCGLHHVSALTEEGTVVRAVDQEGWRNDTGTTDWNHVTAIAAAFDYTLGLHADGTVSYSGPKAEMAQQIAAWENVAAIAADSQYAIGLTGDGQVLLAGSCKPVLDGGRSEARDWKDIVCIGAGHSVIAGLTSQGKLLLAGWCLHRDAIIEGFQAANPANL